MRYLVTGGAGFIGSHLVEALLHNGDTVVVLDDFSTGKRENIPPASDSGVTIIEGSITDEVAVRAAMVDCGGVFHLAAIASVTQSVEAWTATHRINQSGAVQVFEVAAEKMIPVVYASSAAIYGDCPAVPLAESALTEPLSPYGLDKLACEWQARMGYIIKGLHSVGLRFFNVYGPRQDPASPYSGVISIFMERCRRRQPLRIYGDGLQTRDFIYVGDVVAHLQAAMQQLAQRRIDCAALNVCTGEQVSVQDLASLLQQISRNTGGLEFSEPRSGDIRFSCGNPEKAIKQLGIKAQTDLAEGLEITWQSVTASS